MCDVSRIEENDIGTTKHDHDICEEEQVVRGVSGPTNRCYTKRAPSCYRMGQGPSASGRIVIRVV